MRPTNLTNPFKKPINPLNKPIKFVEQSNRILLYQIIKSVKQTNQIRLYQTNQIRRTNQSKIFRIPAQVVCMIKSVCLRCAY